MSKQVLVITKPDKTRHIAPLENEAILKSMNNRLAEGSKWKIEKMDEADAEKLDWIDESIVTGAEAVTQNEDLKKEVESKDAEIEELRKQLAALQASKPAPAPEPAKAADVIEKINAAQNAEEVDALIAGETRKTVLDAAEKKKASF